MAYLDLCFLWGMGEFYETNLWGMKKSRISAVEKKMMTLWKKDCLKERYTTSC